MLPAEAFGTPTQQLAGRDRRAGQRLNGQFRLDLLADRVQLADVEIVEAIGRPPPVDDLLRGAPVQPGVDLRAASGAAALGVGDRRAADRRSDPAGAVLAVHLLERERHDVALVDEVAFLHDEHVESRFGEQRCRRAAACTGPDDEDVGTGGQTVDGLQAGHRRQRAAPSAAVAGHVSHTYAYESERTKRT